MLAFLQLITPPFMGQAGHTDQPSVHTIITLILSLLVVAVALAVVAPRLKIPYPILLVLGGLLLGFIPGLPVFTLNPDLVFLLFLPPLLYSSAWTTSWRDFHNNLRPISLLAIGLVFMTTIVIAVVAHLVVPDFPWAAAFVLGAIISPTDAVAATSIAQRLGVPRRIVTVLEGESMINDASGLVAYQFAVAAVVAGTFSLWNAGLQFIGVSVGGVLVGLALGWGLTFVHRHMDNSLLEIVITLLTPFTAYLLAEALHVSGVLATVATGLYLTRKSSTFFSAQTRQEALTVWSLLVFLLNGLVFIFIGLQLHSIIDTLKSTIVHYTLVGLIGYGVVISLATILVRIVWVVPATYLPRFFSRRIRARDPYPNWRNVSVIAWTGMRGVVSLAAALALPEMTDKNVAFPERPLIIYLTFCVILATLVLQGLSLPFVIRTLGLKEDGEAAREEVLARQVSSHAALNRIDELIERGEAPRDAAEHLREHYEVRAQSIAASAGSDEGEQEESQLKTYQAIQQETLKAAHQSVINLRDKGEISDEVMRRIEREIDLEEQVLEE